MGPYIIVKSPSLKCTLIANEPAKPRGKAAAHKSWYKL